MTEYALQITDLASGRITVTLYSEFASLELPGYASLILDGELSEAVDITAGEINVREMQVRFIEDYRVYAEGFWNKVLHGDHEIRIRRNSGVGDYELLWGAMKPKTLEMEEISLITDEVRRRGEFTLIDKIGVLRDVLCSDVVTDIGTRTTLLTFTNNGAESANVFPICTVFASMLYVSGLNASYDIDDVVFDDASELDLMFQWGVVYPTFTSAYLMYSVYYTVGGWISGYQVTKWQEECGTAWDLLSKLANDFAFVPRIYYDTGDSRWKIKLSTYGRAALEAESYVEPPVPISSRQIDEEESAPRSIFVQSPFTGVYGENLQWWTVPDPVDPDTYYRIGDPSPHPIDRSISLGWDFVDHVLSTAAADRMQIWLVSESVLYYVDGLAVYSYAHREWGNLGVGASGTRIWYETHRMAEIVSAVSVLHPMLGYYRTYPGIQDSLGLLSVTQIDVDGVTKEFIAKEVSVNLVKNQTSVKWVLL